VFKFGEVLAHCLFRVLKPEDLCVFVGIFAGSGVDVVETQLINARRADVGSFVVSEGFDAG